MGWRQNPRHSLSLGAGPRHCFSEFDRETDRQADKQTTTTGREKKRALLGMLDSLLFPFGLFVLSDHAVSRGFHWSPMGIVCLISMLKLDSL